MIYVRNIYVWKCASRSLRKNCRAHDNACSSVFERGRVVHRERETARAVHFLLHEHGVVVAIGQDIGLPQRARGPRLDFYVTHSALKQNANLPDATANRWLSLAFTSNRSHETCVSTHVNVYYLLNQLGVFSMTGVHALKY